MDWMQLIYVVVGAVIAWLYQQMNKSPNPTPTPTPTPNPVPPPDNPTPSISPDNKFLLDLVQALINKLHLSRPLSAEEIHPDAVQASPLPK